MSGPRYTNRPALHLITIVVGCVIALLAGPAHARVIDDFGTYQPQVSCDPVAKPGVVAFKDLMHAKFGGGDLGIVRACSVGGLSEHKEGRAWDWALNANKAKDRRIASRALNWLTKTVDGEPAANARSLGVMYMIFDEKIWRAYNPSLGWQPYTGASPHTDHVHVSFTWNGATKATAWWTGDLEPFDYGPCVKWVGEMASPWRQARLDPCPVPIRRPVANAKGIYLAQTGETVRRVARFFDITRAQVRAWNGYPARGKVGIEVGERIYVVEPGVPG